jgi:serine kinase of HPr protein (carbohydrate metabolism regulator)
MCVVVHNDKPIPQTMCQVADTLGIPLVSSPLTKYESCIAVWKFLESEKSS